MATESIDWNEQATLHVGPSSNLPSGEIDRGGPTRPCESLASAIRHWLDLPADRQGQSWIDTDGGGIISDLRRFVTLAFGQIFPPKAQPECATIV